MAARKTLRVVAVLAVVVVLVVLVIVLNRPQGTNKHIIGVIEPMEHVAISDITRGIKEGLANCKNMEIRVMNASGDATTIAQIIDKYKDIGVTVYVPIFTKTAQVVKSKVTDKPVVFAAVTDPVSAGLVKDPDSPEGNITGVSDLWPIGANLDLIRQVLPSAKTIGMVYDPGDASSAVTVPLITKEAKARGFKLALRPVYAASEIAQSLASLEGKADLLFTANDVTVTAAFPALVAFAIQKKMPLFAGDYSSVQRGAICAMGQNYYNVGAEAAKVIVAVADGKKLSGLPVRYTKGGDIYINAKAAELMGVQVPKDLLAKAKEIYAEISGKAK